MDWNSKAPVEWDWENLAMFSGKTSELTKQVDGGDATENASMYSGFSSSELGYHHNSSSRNSILAFADSSSLGGGLRTEEASGMDSNRNFSTLGASVASSEPMIGLKLGRRTYFEDMSASGTTKVTSLSGSATSSSTTMTKRSRASYQSTQSPCCQVEGCNLELKSAKDYHRRHRICEAHSKSPRVIVAGLERRFCQQCSRFHDLSEFDDKKRSCRRRLSDHNARRRRPHPEPIHFGSSSLSPSSYDGRHPMNFLMNRIPVPVSLPPWHDTYNYKVTQPRDAMNMSAKSTGSDRQPHTSSEELPHSLAMLHSDSDRMLSFQSTSSKVLNHDSAPSAMDVAPDLRRALSLLSSNSWGVNEHEPASLEQFRDTTQTSMPQPDIHTEPPNGALSSSQYMQMEQAPNVSRVQSLDSHSSSSSQFQEFQLFRGPYEPACYYPYQIN